MPLSGTGDVLGEAIKAAVDAEQVAAERAKRPIDRDAMFKAMGRAIVAHLTATAGAGAVAGVTVGGGVANLV